MPRHSTKAKLMEEYHELVRRLEKSGVTNVKFDDISQSSKVDEIKKAIEMLESVLEVEEAGEDAEEVIDVVAQESDLTNPEENEPNPESIQMWDPKWTDYVLSELCDYEKDNNHPKTDGLRRIAMRELGPFSSDTKVVEAASMNNADRATVVVTLKFSNKTISGAADVYPGNTAKEFAIHPTATAETRAEGRALRRALMLTKIITAEEATQGNEDGLGSQKLASKSVLTSLNIMAQKLDIDVLKLALYNKFEVETLEDLTHEQAMALSEEMGKYQRKEHEHEEVPDAVKK